jgi:DNA-binding MarR family transcriptional regulator
MTTPAPREPDVTARLARLLPELAVALYESAPHHGEVRRDLAPASLTGRQMEAVLFLAHRGAVTMGEFSAGLQISRAAASELVARLLEKGVVRREADDADRRVVRVRLAGAAEAMAEEALGLWRARLTSVFARYPDIDPGTLVAFLGALIHELKGRATP